MLNSSESIENKDLIIFGTGEGAQRVYNHISDNNKIIFYADSNKQTWGTTFKDSPVIPPSKVKEKDFDYIIIASVAREEIFEKLKRIGIKPKEIISPDINNLPVVSPEMALNLLRKNQDLNNITEKIAALIKTAVKQQFLNWPAKFSEYIKDKSILDFGCGQGQHGLGFWVYGASNYLGIDPHLAINQKKTHTMIHLKRDDFEYTPNQIQNKIKKISYHPGYLADFMNDNPKQKFELVVARYVTEHIKNLEETLEQIHNILTENGLFIFSHHNFYAWNGHHCTPRTIDEINLKNPEHEKVMDWNHLNININEAHRINRSLNRIRLPELRTQIKKYFKIKKWELHPTNARKGRKRFSPELKKQYPKLKEYEFLSQGIFCMAIKK